MTLFSTHSGKQMLWHRGKDEKLCFKSGLLPGEESQLTDQLSVALILHNVAGNLESIPEGHKAGDMLRNAHQSKTRIFGWVEETRLPSRNPWSTGRTYKTTQEGGGNWTLSSRLILTIQHWGLLILIWNWGFSSHLLFYFIQHKIKSRQFLDTFTNCKLTSDCILLFSFFFFFCFSFFYSIV